MGTEEKREVWVGPPVGAGGRTQPHAYMVVGPMLRFDSIHVQAHWASDDIFLADRLSTLATAPGAVN